MSAPEQVAVVVTWRGRVGLFRDLPRADRKVAGWRCLRADLDSGEDALAGAARVLLDATGLVVRDLVALESGPVLQLEGEDGPPRRVTTVLAQTDRRRLLTDPADLLHRWVRRDHLARFDGQVAWLRQVVGAVECDGAPTAASCR